MKIELTIRDDEGFPFSGTYETEREDLGRTLESLAHMAKLYFEWGMDREEKKLHAEG